MAISQGGLPSAVEEMARTLHRFVLGGLPGDETTLDASDHDPATPFAELADADSVKLRNDAINAPLMLLRSLREPDVAALEGMGIETIGQLVQHDFWPEHGPERQPLSMAVSTALDHARGPLEAMRLSYLMSADDVRQWILGADYGDEKTSG